MKDRSRCHRDLVLAFAALIQLARTVKTGTECDHIWDNDNPLAIEAETGDPCRLPQWKTFAGTRSGSIAVASPLFNLPVDIGVACNTIAEQKQ